MIKITARPEHEIFSQLRDRYVDQLELHAHLQLIIPYWKGWMLWRGGLVVIISDNWSEFIGFAEE